MFGKFLESIGVKRLIASALSAVVEVLRAIPGTGEFVTIIEMIAGFFGITGITHAGAEGTLTKKKLASASAAVASLIALSYVVPQLAVFRPWLEKIAALLGSAAIGAQITREGLPPKSDDVLPESDDFRDYGA